MSVESKSTPSPTVIQMPVYRGNITSFSDLIDYRAYYRWYENHEGSTSTESNHTEVTVVTQMSLGRVWHFENGICKSWHGPISISVFVREDENDWDDQLKKLISNYPKNIHK